jgi:hypothetical protein
VVIFDVITPGEYITDEEIHLNIEVWNKGTFKDELLGVVTMSTTRFFQNPYISFEENVPIALPGDRSSTSKVCHHITYSIYNIMLFLILYF